MKKMMMNLAKDKVEKPINVSGLKKCAGTTEEKSKDLADKICVAMETVKCHQDVTIIDDPVRRGHAFLNKGKEFLFLSVVEESYLPKPIRAMLKAPDKFWCKVGDQHDLHECDNQLCMLLPTWAINHGNLKVVENGVPMHTFRQTPEQAARNRQDMFRLNEVMLEKKTKKKLKALLKRRGWSVEDIDGAIKELWPEAHGKI